MRTLESIQQSFLSAIFQEKTIQPDIIASNYPAQRLAIYRQTILHTLYNALALTFPGIWVLIGEDCANHLAKLFCQDLNHLPTQACLDDWGAQFPKFIGQQKALSHLPYLQDYAEYEWLKHRSFCAPFSTFLTYADLQLIQETELETLQLSFAPSVFVFHSKYPLNEIETLIENPDAETIDINSIQSYALITRRNNEVHTQWIAAELYTFIEFLRNKHPLGQAFKKTQEKYPQFNLTQSLQFLIQSSISSELMQNCFK